MAEAREDPRIEVHSSDSSSAPPAFTETRPLPASSAPLQAAARGWRCRRRHGMALQHARLATRVALLEAQLAEERRTRELHEMFMRKLGNAVKALVARRPVDAGL